MHLLRACSASNKQACRQLKLVVVFDIAYYKFIREQSRMSEHAESDVAQEQDDDELVNKKSQNLRPRPNKNNRQLCRRVVLAKGVSTSNLLNHHSIGSLHIVYWLFIIFHIIILNPHR